MRSFSWLEELVEQQMKNARIPGLALAVVQEQEILYARGFGVTGVEDGGLPVNEQTLFRIGSVTKPLTGTVLMRLAEAGKLNLDRPVRDYVPQFSLSDESASQIVTLRMLLSQTSGLPTEGVPFGSRNPDGLAAFMRNRLPEYELLHPPATAWAYSNPGLNAAGYVAEVVCGKPFAEVMQELLFEPLEMKRTTFDPLIAMTYPLAQAHTLLPNKTLSVQHRFAENTSEYPSGFAMSTALDLAHFAMLHVNHGQFGARQLLSSRFIDEMHTKQVNLTSISDEGYGLTFYVDTYKGEQRVMHNGAIRSFGCILAIIPSKVAVAVLDNRTHDYRAIAIANRVIDYLLDLPEEER